MTQTIQTWFQSTGQTINTLADNHSIDLGAKHWEHATEIMRTYLDGEIQISTMYPVIDGQRLSVFLGLIQADPNHALVDQLRKDLPLFVYPSNTLSMSDKHVYADDSSIDLLLSTYNATCQARNQEREINVSDLQFILLYHLLTHDKKIDPQTISRVLNGSSTSNRNYMNKLKKKMGDLSIELFDRSKEGLNTGYALRPLEK